MTWDLGTFDTVSSGGITTRSGAVSGPFGIDRRVDRDPINMPYFLTHIPTGHLICRARTWQLAETIAAELDCLGDWSSTHLQATPPGARAVVERYVRSGDAWCRQINEPTTAGR